MTKWPRAFVLGLTVIVIESVVVSTTATRGAVKTLAPPARSEVFATAVNVSKARAERIADESAHHLASDGAKAAATTLSHVTPARMLPRASSPLPSELIWPVLNGWYVSDRRTDTGVWAGAAGERYSMGSFAILRHNYVHARQKADTVNVPRAGPLKITRAPLGRRVVTSAQRHGHLWFKSKRGVHGVLRLSNDTVRITHSP
jgi:hypothetical protein